MEVLIVGEKNIFKKPKFFNKDSFYVILFICLCIVAVAAVVITRSNERNISNKLGDSKLTEEKKTTQPNNEPTLIEEKRKGNTVPASNLPKQTTSNNPQNSTNNSTSTKKSQRSSVVSFKLEKPVDGQIVKPFNDTKPLFNKTLNQWETHEGIDIEADLGTEVKAAADGKVLKIFKDDKIVNTINKTGFGVTVVVDHGNGYQTVYCNLAEDLKVKEGQKVTKGQVIVVVGDTSVRESVAIEGSHLHFMLLKKNGSEYVPVDPQKFFK
jgi:murein DD-endopeptidase MepM/ murein hydrolase activator NlpD